MSDKIITELYHEHAGKNFIVEGQEICIGYIKLLSLAAVITAIIYVLS